MQWLRYPPARTRRVARRACSNKHRLATHATRSAALILSALWMVVGGCSASNAQRDRVTLPEQVSGCYELELWPGESGPQAERQRAAWSSAPTVKLDTAKLTTWPSLVQQYGTVFVAHSITEGRAWDHPFNYWRLVAGDSLFVGHPGALAGVSMTLHIEGQDLRGEITSFTDVPVEGKPTTRTAPVFARRVECPITEN